MDLIDEVRDETSKQMEKYRAAMARYYNKKVKVRRFNLGDLVLRKVSQATKDSSQGKLGPAWEGPYQVIRHSREGSYYLTLIIKGKENNVIPLPLNFKSVFCSPYRCESFSNSI